MPLWCVLAHWSDLDKCSDVRVWEQAYPVFFGKSLHFLVEEEVHSQSVTGAVGEDGAENLAVLVVHLLRHVHQHCLVDFLDVDPEQKKGEVNAFHNFQKLSSNLQRRTYWSTDFHLPVEVRSACVLVRQLEPGIRHHLVNIGTFVGIRLEKLL